MPKENDTNPYASPTTELVEPGRRTRWRIIPVTLLSFYGLMGLVSVPIMFLVACMRPVEYGGGISAALVLGMLLFFGSSALWLITAVLCWKGKWRWMILTFLVALAAAVVGEHVVAGLGFG